MNSPYRNRGHGSSYAALAHRLSGLALAAFLPAHFWLLGLSLSGEAALEGMIAWTALAPVKLAEWGLVVLLTLHLSLGLRVLALEFLPWHHRQQWMSGIAVAAAAALGIAFALNLAIV
ncbi:MAG TPA: succinate dehydrogenase [Casimicrobiaceae bacterium]|nr:succinate dehydrogenase [Casimicrobiaceae bacterium]